MSQEWRPIPEYEGLYEISKDGQVKSLAGAERTRRNTDRILKHQIYPSGYHYVNLYGGPVRMRHCYIHQLILKAFVGPRPPGMAALHWDDDKDNNTLENLRWGTWQENGRDSVRNGTSAKAAKTHCPHGHPYAGDNLIIGKNGGRFCRACARENGRKQRLRMGITPRISAN